MILHPWSLGCPFPVLGVEVPGQPPDLGPPSWRRGRVPPLSPRWLLCFQAGVCSEPGPAALFASHLSPLMMFALHPPPAPRALLGSPRGFPTLVPSIPVPSWEEATGNEGKNPRKVVFKERKLVIFSCVSPSFGRSLALDTGSWEGNYPPLLQLFLIPCHPFLGGVEQEKIKNKKKGSRKPGDALLQLCPC